MEYLLPHTKVNSCESCDRESFCFERIVSVVPRGTCFPTIPRLAIDNKQCFWVRNKRVAESCCARTIREQGIPVGPSKLSSGHGEWVRIILGTCDKSDMRGICTSVHTKSKTKILQYPSHLRRCCRRRYRRTSRTDPCDNCSFLGPLINTRARERARKYSVQQFGNKYKCRKEKRTNLAK